MRRGRLATALVLGCLVAAPLTVVPDAEASRRHPAVVEHRVIGRTVQGRPIHAWRVGDPGARVKAVAIAGMHGDEMAPSAILLGLRNGAPIAGVDLWLIPAHNADGVARGTRKNARGVDLNRNFPRRWRDLDGVVESGHRPASEPETRALMRFLNRVDPRFVVSFHQPLNGIDTYGSKNRWFARRLADNLNLPRKEFACGGSCYGTFTQWFNHEHAGTTVTVEYGPRPGWRRMNIRAPRQLLRSLGGWRT
jgi:protein MpaA